MKQITANTLVETELKGANHGFVTTSDGIVMIDSPHKPSDALKLKAEIARRGRLRYIINTEPHGDHWTGNAFFDVPVVAHEGVRTRILETNMEEHVARVATFGPEEPKLLEGYRPNAPVDHVQGRHDAARGQPHLRDDPHARPHGVTRRRSASRRKASSFTSDNIFHKCHTWLQEANPDEWLVALESLRNLKEEVVRAGPRPGLRQGVSRRAGLVHPGVEGLRPESDRARHDKGRGHRALTAMTDRYPMDVGQDGMAPSVMKRNVANLYDYLTAAGIHKHS